MTSEEFAQLYRSAKQLHPDVADLSDDDLERIGSQLWKERLESRRRDYMIFSTLLPLLYVAFVVSLVSNWQFAQELAEKSSAYDFRTALGVVPGLAVGIGVGILAALTYFVILPFEPHLTALLRKDMPRLMGHLKQPTTAVVSVSDYRQPRFAVGAAAGLYVAVGAALVLVAALAEVSQPLLSALFLAWLVPLLVILSATPSALVILLVALLLKRHLGRVAWTEAQVIVKLLGLLTKLGNVSSTETVWGRQRTNLADQIHQVSEAVRRLYFGRPPMDKAGEWTRRQMELAADNILVLSSWLYLSQASTDHAVRQRLVAVSNAFLTGRLDDLPREVLGEDQGLALPRRRRRAVATALHALALLAYAAAPVVAYLILRQRLTPIAFPETLLLVLYALWLAIGLFAYVEHTTEDPGALLLDLAKSVIGR